MIHPSYVELMKVVNDDVVIGEEPVVNSRYSIVCAAARRARQLIDGSEPLILERNVYGKKPLSIAVDELYNAELKILTSEEADEEQEKLNQLREETAKKRVLVEAKRAKEAEENGEKTEPAKEKKSKAEDSEKEEVPEEAPEEEANVAAFVDSLDEIEPSEAYDEDEDFDEE